MTHATKTAAAAALALGLVLTATSTAQAGALHGPSITAARTTAAATGGDVASQLRDIGVPHSHGAHRNIQPTPTCPICG